METESLNKSEEQLREEQLDKAYEVIDTWLPSGFTDLVKEYTLKHFNKEYTQGMISKVKNRKHYSDNIFKALFSISISRKEEMGDLVEKAAA